MEQARFEAMVARLERESAQAPRAYQFKVALLALLGFCILALLIASAGFGLVLLAGIALAALLGGAKFAVLLLKLGKLLLLLAVPLWFLVKSAVQALFTRLPAPQGLEIERSQAPALFQAMDDMRRRMKGPRFHHVLVTDEVNAAVVQRPLFGLVGWPRNYLVLGLPLLEALGPDEALAVVAHEYGHLAGSHGRFGAYIYRLRNTWATIQAISEQWQGWSARLLRRVVGWYAPYFNAYTFVLARANEYQADAASAELVGAPVAANALKRVSLSAAHWGAHFEQTFARIAEQPAPPSDVWVRWAQAAPFPPADKTRGWLDAALARAPHVADTHPVLRERLRALRIDVQAEPPPLGEVSAAQAWLGPQAAQLRTLLQSQWQERVAQPWKDRHDELQAQKRRLAELRALAQPALDEQLEALRLAIALEPDEDHLPALQAFNAAQPDHPVGLFFEGRWRLEHDDAGGLALLERAIELDADATKAASECAVVFLASRDAAAAEVWRERWLRRDAWDTARHNELQALDRTHELQPPALDDEAMAHIQQLLATHGKGLKSAVLARRVLPSDPGLPTYVMALRLGAWARLRGHQAPIVNRLAAQEWPMHVFFCALDQQPRAYRKRLARAGTQLRLR
ncbi:M48 family metalloprotease [Caldimonas sp. KR1-144]|uniref:M48 family metalloprotease n=1 Tax=Caldimonas sp. KR1-144 TaxID=3400911 RepID=UPI003C095942